MIIGHGIDIVNLNRFSLMNPSRLNKIAQRICTEFELEEFKKNHFQYQYLAKIWASKEAIAKAFKTGIRGKVTWKNIQIKSNTNGSLSVWFKDALVGPNCHLSISHEKDYLIASAILEIL